MSEENGIAEQPAQEMSLSDEIGAAFDELSAEPVEEVAEEVASEVSSDSAEEPAIEVEETALSAPDNWSAEDKATFNALSEAGEQGKAAQEFLLTRHKSMEGDYTRKSQENAEAMRGYEPLQKAFEPYQAALAAQGMTPADKVGQWAQIEQNLNQNPTQTLQWLAQQHGVDLNTMEVEQPNVELTGLRGELQELRNSIAQRDQAEQQREQAEQQIRLNTVESQIQEFSELKTEAGELAHPYFEEVMDEIVALARTERQAGREPELSALYDKAVWMNPTVRDKVLTSQREQEEKKRAEVARQKAAKAQHAASSISGTPDGASPVGDLSLREQISEAYG